MRKCLLIVLMLVCITPLVAESSEIPVSTSTENGRFEFIQSTIGRRLSFILDKYNGKVVQMVQVTEEGSIAFLPVLVDDPSEEPKSQKINYQLYMSGVALRDCFLLNINTGEIWQLAEDEEGTLSFVRIITIFDEEN